MDILENEFTEISRLKAQGNVSLSLGTLEVYLFIVRLGMKGGGFCDIEAKFKLFERQGVSRRRLAKAVAELAAAGLLERTVGVGATPTRYTLPRLAAVQPAAEGAVETVAVAPAVEQPTEQPAAATAAPPKGNESVPIAAALPPRDNAPVTLEEAVETLRTESKTLKRLIKTQMTPEIEQALAARLPRLGKSRGTTLVALVNLAWAVNWSAYLKEHLSLAWLFEGGNLEKVLNGRYKDKRDPYEGRDSLSPGLIGNYDYFVHNSYKGWLANERGYEFRPMVDGIPRNCYGQTKREYRAEERQRIEEMNRDAVRNRERNYGMYARA